MEVAIIFGAMALLGVSNNFCAKIFILNCAGKRAAMIYNMCWSTLAAIAYGIITFAGGQSIAIHDIVIGVFAGVGYAFALYYALMALENFSVATVTLAGNLGVIVPIIGGCLFFDEVLTLSRISGVILLFISVYVIVSADKQQKKECTLAGILQLVFIFLTNGIVSMSQKLYGELYPEANLMPFSFITFLTAAVICVAVFSLNKKEKLKNFDKRFCFVPVVACIGICLINQLSIMLAGKIQASLQFPINVSLTLSLTTVMAALVFKEKITVRKLVGIVLCVAGVFYNAM